MAETKTRHDVLFDSMAQGAFFQLADGSIADVNDAALRMLGLDRDEFATRLSTPGWRVVREDEYILSIEELPSSVALSTGTPVRDFVAGIYNRRRNAYTWMNINAIPLFRPGDSRPYQVLVTLHDISEQKRISDIHLCRIHLMEFAGSHSLQELLVEALDELERLTESVIGFYLFFDEESRNVVLSEWSTRTKSEFCRAQNVGAYSIDEAGVWADCIHTGTVIIHNDYESLPHKRGLPPGHAPVIRQVLAPVKRNGRTVAIVAIGNKPTDYTEDDANTLALLADLTWDIAERKKAEAQLLKATRELQTLTNTSMDAYWVVDAEGKILSANETTCQMWGYTMEEILTQKISDLDALESDEEVREHIALVKKRGYDRFETRHRHRDGRIVRVEVSAARGEGGTVLAFCRDITAQNKMQEELLRSRKELKLANQLLEQRVAQRTADLHAVIREHEAFSYSVSHDLRAPLRHINSFSTMLEEDFGDFLPKEARHYLERMKAASNRMGALIDHLLELSRVARTEISFAPVDLSEMATITLRMLRETEPHRRVEHHIDPGIVVSGDHHLLRQLLDNLLGNAWKYTSGTPSPCIELRKTVLFGEDTYFVRDNGAGFEMTYSDKLFKPFQRLHGAEFEGVGIGLATAQRIVERHGGRIWAEGGPRKGATFYFTLPAAKEVLPRQTH